MDQSQWIDTHADGHVEIDGRPIPVVTANTVVVGTGGVASCASAVPQPDKSSASAPPRPSLISKAA